MPPARQSADLPHSGLVEVFVASGFILASWGSRLPALRGSADLAPETIGWVVGCLGIGSLVALLLAAPIVRALGDVRSIRFGAWLSSVVLGLGVWDTSHGSIVMITAAGLGFGNGVYDVAMNAHATRHQRTERARSMAGLHGWFSVGALAGAGIAALLTRLGLPLEIHLTLVALVTVAMTEHALRATDLTVRPVQRPRGWREFTPRFAAWRNRRTWALGFLALGAVFAEGAANEWLTTALTDGTGFNLSQTQAASALAVFAAGMVVMRLPLGSYTRETARGVALAASLILVSLGTGAVIIASWARSDGGWPLIVAFTGLFCWGAGAALGVPFALAAAGSSSKEKGAVRDRSEASDRVSVVQTVGFGFLIAAAPLLSWAGKHIGFIWILAAAPLVMAAGFAISALLHPRGTTFTAEARRQGMKTVAIAGQSVQFTSSGSGTSSRPKASRTPSRT